MTVEAGHAKQKQMFVAQKLVSYIVAELVEQAAS
jgi:hypothetical protein